MTRYRQKTRRGIIIFLFNEGASTLGEMAQGLGKEERVISNYLYHFREDFEVEGKGNKTKWKTIRTLRVRGRAGSIEIV